MRTALVVVLLLAAPALAKAPASIPASALIIRQTSPAIDWRWRAAPEAAAVPPLFNALRADALKLAAKARSDAAADAASARKAGIPFRRYESITDWTRAADTPRLLALAGEVYSFTGGAHGNTGYAARVWDKTSRRSIGIEGLFSDWPRARKLIEPGFCKALAEEQTRRLGASPTSEMNACPKLSEQPILPWGGLSTRASQYRVLVGPYVAGSYAEGSYLVTVPWPAGVRTLVKPAYRADLFGDDG
ncbi:MAG: PdaC/SigV domain-containing protein [Polymorphobacter sp.]